MKRLHAVAGLFVLVTLAGCSETLSPDTRVADPQYSPGGVPGAPPWAIIRIPDVPPPHVPPNVPRHAGPPGFLTDVIDIGAGGLFSCALRSDGAAFCWGANNRGQLGDGTQASSAVPVEVTGGHVFAELVVGNMSACGLTATGAAYCWGDNQQGQLGAGISGLQFSRDPVAVAGGHLFTNLSLGLTATCGVATDGVTYCWGSNQFGLFGNGTVGGSSNVPVPIPTSSALGFSDVSVGFLVACADGTAGHYCWGQQRLLGNGSSATTIVSTPTLAAGGASLAVVDAGTQYACALDGAGGASCWGIQLSGELGTGSTTASSFTPAAVLGGHSFSTIDARPHNSVLGETCALDAAAAAWCWGSNQYGELGGPSSETCTLFALVYDCSSTPVPVSGGHSFNDIAVGITHVCAVTTAGNAYCWGHNSMGQLGDGTTVNSPAPIQVRGLDDDLRTYAIVVTPYAPTLILLGSTVQFTAQAVDLNGVPLSAQPAFAWSSSAPAVAAVSSTGLATALSDGGATIIATAPDGTTGRAAITVRLIDPARTFLQAYVGDGGTTSDGVVVLGGLLADEWVHSGTFPTRLQVDQRAITNDNLTVEQAYNHLTLARTALEFEAARLLNVSPSDPRIGQMRTFAGFTYLALAENFCSGVPLDDPNVGLTTSDLFTLALNSFTAALSGPIDAVHTNGAHVGTARAKLGLGDLPGAGAAAALVPLPFTLNTTHSAATGEVNGVYQLNVASERVSLSDIEGANGLAFRSANDPRVTWTRTGGNDIGFDGITPQYDLLKYAGVTSALQLASGVEAGLIAAEAALAVPDPVAFIAHLNALRSFGGYAPVVDPGTAAGRLDLLFSERAFWLFATGHRLGDLRRRIAQYGASAAALFPVGPHHKGGGYGTDANLPVPASVRGSSYNGCTVRTN